MKKRRDCKKIIVASVIAILLLCLVPTYIIGHKPFKDLQASDMKSASVWLIAPMEEIQIEDLESFVDCLQDVVIYQEKIFYDVPDGGEGASYIIEMKDGTEYRVSLNNSHLIIDDVRYRTNSTSYKALNSYGHGLRK